MDYEVAVIGAGPAGAATATLLARAGRRVLLLDKARFPRDKICGEALSAAALPILARLGVLGDLEAQGLALRGVVLRSPEGRTCRALYPALPGLPDHGLAISRLVLDAALVAAARREPSLEFQEGLAATGLLWEGDRCVGVRTSHQEFCAQAVVCAEGRFARLGAGLQRHPRPAARKRRAFVATFDGVQGLTECLELIIRSSALQLLVSPQGAQRAALCALLTGPNEPIGTPPLSGLLQILRSDPALRGRLEDARAITPLKGLILEPYSGEAVPAAGLVAVGDATGFFDPLTGEGMYRALRSAELATQTLLTALSARDVSLGQLASYRARLRGEFAWTYRFVRTVVALTHWETGVNLAIRALERKPELASRLAGYQGALIPAQRFFPDLVHVLLDGLHA